MCPTFTLYDDAAIGKRATSLIGECVIVLTPRHRGPHPHPRRGRDHPLHRRADDPVARGAGRRHPQGRQGRHRLASRTPSAATSGQEQIAEILKNVAEVDRAAQRDREGEPRRRPRRRSTTSTRITGDARPQIAEILQNVKQVTEDVRKMTAAGRRRASRAASPARSAAPSSASTAPAPSLESALAHADNVAGAHRPRRGHHRPAHQGRDAHQRGRGRRRGRRRSRRRHRPRADGRRPAHRLQLPRQHHQELRRAPPPARRGQVLLDRARQRPARQDEHRSRPTSTRRTPTTRAHYRETITSTTQRLPLLVPVRQAHRPVHRPLRHQGVDRRHRPRHAPPRTTASSSGRTSSASARSCRPAGASRSATSSSASCGCSAASTTS